MLEWNVYLYIDTLRILCGPKSPISIVFLVADESTNDTIICSASPSNHTSSNASGVKVDVGLTIFCCT